MPASYPSATKSFTTKNAGNTIDADHVNDLQLEVTAIETDLRTAFPATSGASGGQIKFPGTQNPSTDVNTLDDYEEGSWTPVLGGSGGTSGQTYNIQVGSYVKIGKLVTATFRMSLTALGTVTTDVQVQGLPFTSASTSNGSAAMVVGRWGNLTTSIVFLSGVLSASSTAITLWAATAATGSQAKLAQADLANTSYLEGSITYIAAA